MSQINEALKRAKKSQKEQAPPLPPAAPPLPPLPSVEPESRGGLGWLVLIILIVAIACFFIGLAFTTRKPATEPAVTVTNVVQAAAAPVVPPKPVAPTNVVVPPPKPAPPALKLEGILYVPGQPPQAIVNGQTVYTGDTVNGFRVKTISKNNVSFVAADGTEKNLALSE
jgi:hypothetical protein